jgi:hypothetical protein
MSCINGNAFHLRIRWDFKIASHVAPLEDSPMSNPFPAQSLDSLFDPGRRSRLILIYCVLLFVLPAFLANLPMGLMSYAPAVSDAEWFGLPVYPINQSLAIAWFAHGAGAIGLVACGALCAGVICIGNGIGVIAMGGGTIGVIAWGGGAAGFVAIGGGAVGYVAIGGGAWGRIAIGGAARGTYVIAGEGAGRYVIDHTRCDAEAIKFFSKHVPGFRWALA